MSTLNYPPMPFLTDPEKGLKTAVEAYKGGNADAALVIARRVSDQFPDTQWSRRAQFLAMQAMIKLDRTEEADGAMLRIQEEYPELADYALFLLAEYRFSGARYSEAAALYQQVTERFPRSLLASRSAYRRGAALLGSYSYAEAVDVFEAYLRDYPHAEFAAEARLGLARALTAEARLEQAVRTYRDLWIRYPAPATDQEVERSLADLRGGGAVVAEFSDDELFQRGRNLLLAGQNEKAVDIFRKLLERGPDSPNRPELLFRTGIALFNLSRRDAAATLETMVRDHPSDPRAPEALYWAGKAYSKSGDGERAVKSFQKILDRYPDSEWCRDALFFTGNVYRDAGEKKKTLQAYRRLARDYPDSKYADSALWWIAWTNYSSGEYKKTEQTLGELIKRFPRSALVNQAFYWQGKAAEKEKDARRASTYYTRLVKKAPYSYYGSRAADRLARLKSGDTAVPADMPQDCPADCAEEPCPGDPGDLPVPAGNDEGQTAWTEEAKQALSADASYKKTLELMSLDMKKEAAQELSALRDRMPRKRGMLIGLSKAFFELGDYYHSMTLVLRNFERYLDGSVDGAADDVWLLAYPQGYWESIQSYARRYGQDPFFIAAVIREESQFASEALSPAGARGVMQVMPATGAKVAKQIKLSGFGPDRLFDADTAINIGTWYIGSLMKRFKGDPLLVAAAYNAGPEAVQAWIGKNGYHGDDDAFVESIPYFETRGYVKKVLRNYAEYRRIYGKAASFPPQVRGGDGGKVSDSDRPANQQGETGGSGAARR